MYVCVVCGDIAVTDVHYLAVFLTPYLAGVDGSVYNDWIMNRRQPHPVVGKHGLACVNPSNVAISGEICLEHLFVLLSLCIQFSVMV